MNIYYLSETKGNKRDAGSKARNDVDDILNKEGFIAINMLNKDDRGSVKIGILISSFLKQIFSIPKGSVIISQYPIYDKSVFIRFYLKWMKKHKNIKHIALIHDINSLRAQNKEKMVEEVERLNIFDACISHNPKMSKWLSDSGIKSKIINLGIFDYLIDDKLEKRYEKQENDYIVCFAGNLAEDKSGFVYKLDKRIKLNLYGPNYSGDDKSRYKGCLKPEELPSVLKEDFGLIWDGVSSEACVGETGEYLRFNNPHKTSLYIASSLPIIIWSKAAVADFVDQYKIGIVIDSLDELYEKISNISESEYMIMKSNINNLRKKLIDGEFTKNAVKEAIKALK